MLLKPEALQKLLDEPIYSWDVSTLLSGIVDFLEFSERNLNWQRRREIQRARQEAEELDFGPEYAHLLPEARRQLVESAELRFDIGLSQSVRYAGVVAYVTSIEWCMELFSARLSAPAPSRPRHKNEAVHILEHINTKLSYPRSVEAEMLEHIVFVRNCIAHAAGLVRVYKHESGVRKAVAVRELFDLRGHDRELRRGLIAVPADIMAAPERRSARAADGPRQAHDLPLADHAGIPR